MTCRALPQVLLDRGVEGVKGGPAGTLGDAGRVGKSPPFTRDILKVSLPTTRAHRAPAVLQQ
eukprot:3886407-Pyramimonas_sp.AAC.1